MLAPSSILACFLVWMLQYGVSLLRWSSLCEFPWGALRRTAWEHRCTAHPLPNYTGPYDRGGALRRAHELSLGQALVFDTEVELSSDLGACVGCRNSSLSPWPMQTQSLHSPTSLHCTSPASQLQLLGLLGHSAVVIDLQTACTMKWKNEPDVTGCIP